MLVAFIWEGGGLEEIAAAGGVVREQKVQPILEGMRVAGGFQLDVLVIDAASWPTAD